MVEIELHESGGLISCTDTPENEVRNTIIALFWPEIASIAKVMVNDVDVD